MADAPSVFLLAGEPSGDRLAAGLVRAFRERFDGNLRLRGLGGPALEAAGVRSLFPIQDIAVMGLTEILPRLPRLLARIREAADAVVDAQPEMVVTVDSPDFMQRVVARARPQLPATRFANYVAPSVWNWRPRRAARLARLYDLQLALLPFEPPWFEAVGLACEFVGHPLVAAAAAVHPDRDATRAAWGLGTGTPVVAVLPGSRAGEIARLGPVFGAALGLLSRRFPQAEFLLPAAHGMEQALAAQSARWPVAVRLLDQAEPAAREQQKRAAFAAADVALAASGTVTLELAAARLPGVVAYRLAPLTWQIARRLVKHDTVTLVNILLGEAVIPEFLQDRCRADLLADALEHLLRDADARARQRAAGQEIVRLLGGEGEPPEQRAVRALQKLLAGNPG